MRQSADILKQYWGFDSFRGVQEDIIRAVLQKRDTLALLPTGGGKSVCFQVPALMMDGLCLVVSPLIALMKDQVENLTRRGIPALALHSGLSYYDVKRCLQQAAAGEIKFLYLSPERLQTRVFREYLPALDISLVAVDEAHCISQWGYDFRPPYLRIAELRDALPGIPVLALTASATPPVQQDILLRLRFENPALFRQSFDRPNISYSVFKADSKINKLLDILNNVNGSSIVYCRNRRQTQQVAELLRLQGLAAEHYHAGLTQERRNTRQESWLKGTTRVIVCTNAFGMGIDKPDVSTVIHFDLPDCLEHYYQEAGRAGRDGKRAFAVAVYQAEDLEGLARLPDQRFPALAQIKQVYQAIADFLDIPVGLGQGNYYDFDLAAFCRNFKLEPQLAMNALKALEHEGHLAFNENIFLPSQVNFAAPKEILEDFESAHPHLEPLVKCLLRTYEGIYDNRVSVNEKFMARLLRMAPEAVSLQLQQLGAFGIIEYLPQKETPQLFFLLNRAPASYLAFDEAGYAGRKKLFSERVQKMLDYINLAGCRSRYINEYFGEPAGADCGACDNCLRKKANAISEPEFNALAAQISRLVNEEGLEIRELLRLMKGTRKEKVWQVLDFLQSERKLSVENNYIRKVAAS